MRWIETLLSAWLDVELIYNLKMGRIATSDIYQPKNNQWANTPAALSPQFPITLFLITALKPEAEKDGECAICQE